MIEILSRLQELWGARGFGFAGPRPTAKGSIAARIRISRATDWRGRAHNELNSCMRRLMLVGKRRNQKNINTDN